MRDIEALRQQLDMGKQYAAMKGMGGDYAFSWMAPKNMADGVYRFRFMPEHPQRCPDGAVLKSTHQIELSADEKERAHVLSWKCGPEFSTYIYEILDCIQQGGLLEKMSDSLKRVVGKLVTWDRWWIPSVWYIKSEKRKVDGKDVEFFYPDDKATPCGKIWEIQAEGLYKKILELWEKYPMICHPQKGSDLQFVKNGTQYSIQLFDTPPEPEPLDPKAAHLLKDENYPDLLKIRKKGNKDHDEIVSLVQSAWWAKRFEKMGIDLSDEEHPDGDEAATEPPWDDDDQG